MKISSTDKKISEIFGSYYFFIPTFQRPYSWDKSNIEEFWNDTILNSDDEYFIGSMVVFKRPDDSLGVVDGQQRLTTITMILAALRNIFRDEGFDDFSAGLQNLIERRNIINNKLQYVLQTESSFPYFQNSILNEKKLEIDTVPKSEEKALEVGFKAVNSYLKDVVDAVKKDVSIPKEHRKLNIEAKLAQVRDKILRLKLIFIELENEDEAYLIFETLNTRGKELSPSDLVKNLLSRHIRNQNPTMDQVKIVWQSIVETVEGAPGEVNIDNFLQHFWLSRYEYTSTQKLYSVIKKTVTKTNAEEVLNELRQNSKIYRALFEPTFRKWHNDEAEIKSSLQSYGLFKVRQQMPLILSIINSYDNDISSKKQTISILSAIEAFIFKYTAVVTTQSTGGLSMMYSSFAKSVSQAKDSEELNRVYSEIKKRLRANCPEIDEFNVSLKSILYTEKYTKNRALIRYMLLKFYGLQNKVAAVDSSLMTIEHIMPQSEIGSAGIDDQLVGSIGNMIVVANEVNSKMANRKFHEKKHILKASGFQFDPILETATKWGEEEILLRFDWMCATAFNSVWKI